MVFTIAVTGDICIDSFQWRTYEQRNEGLKWQRYPQIHTVRKKGEALLLAKLVALATGAKVISPKLSQNDVDSEVLNTVSGLEIFDQVYRVHSFLGFTPPPSGQPKLLGILEDTAAANMVILDDENNGFSEEDIYWPLALRDPSKAPVIIYKTNTPSPVSKLWQHVEKHHLNQTVVVINGDDLRAQGVNLSKGLSWEKTSLDFVWQMDNNPALAFLAKCSYLVVPLGLEGAIYYRNDGTNESHLYFLTYEFEGGFIKEDQGKMFGLTSCFVAGLAQQVVKGLCSNEDLGDAIGEGIRSGIIAAQKYFVAGFGEDVNGSCFPNPAIFRDEAYPHVNKEHIQDVRIRNSKNPNCRACWYIIKDKSASSLAEIAYDIVKYGEKSALKFIPIAQFRHLKTVDRAEIEGYRSIKNLICEYVAAKLTPRPLSIAVFGTPGSGKSFGVTEVAASIAPQLIEKLSFNLAQFETLADLIAAFHKVRDIALEGRLPLVFFDEFDTAYEGRLGWLKYFLAPMQDGVFREGDSVHPLGKAIFVFAGGTTSTFAEFCGELITDENEQKQFRREFQQAKGPDFVSRLRGYVNILGPNQTDQEWDQLFIIRRGMLLRSLIERKVPHLINARDEVQIDNGVLRALLKIPRYKHESRSMEAILEMSRLANANKWEQAHLPSKEQLQLHVDAEQFSRHLMHDAFFSERVELIARDLYALRLNGPWEDLNEREKDEIRNQVKDIPNALHKINYDVISVKERPEVVELSSRDLNLLGAHVHKRWVKQQRRAGQRSIDPIMAPWDTLSSEMQNRFIASIKLWPEILAKAHFKLERMKFLCYCESLGLI